LQRCCRRDGPALRADKTSLQQILQLGYEAYARTHALPDSVRRAVWAIVACRTAVSGGHVQACPEGHIARSWHNSCRHRMCPPWAWVQTERWLVKQQARLLACEHDHVIFTIPPDLKDLWLANVAAMTQLLCASVMRRSWSGSGRRSIWGPRRGCSPRDTPGARRCSCIRTSMVW
jgi:hypothetical protein